MSNKMFDVRHGLSVNHVPVVDDTGNLIASALSNVSTTNLSEGENQYYTGERANTAIDERVTKAFVDNLGIDATQLDGQDPAYYLNYDNLTNVPVDALVPKFVSSNVTINPFDSLVVDSSQGDKFVTFPDQVAANELFLISSQGGNVTVDTANNVINALQAGDDLKVTDGESVLLQSTGAGSLHILYTFPSGVGSSSTSNAQVRALFSASGNITYDANSGIIGEQLTTTDIDEGDNLYYTTSRANSAIDARVNKAFVDALNVDADTLDGVDLLNIARTDIAETFTNDLTVQGNLVVSGTTTTVNTEEVSIADNIIVLNSDESGAPSQNAGIEVERGTSDNVQLRWNEASDQWEFSNDGSNYVKIAESTDDLAEENNLYYTDARARAAISVSGDLSYASETGVISFTERTDAEVLGLLSATGNINYDSANGVISESLTTDDIDEGSNLYFTNARARAAFTAGGDLAYNSNTGVFSFTERTDAEVKALFSAGGDLSYNSSTGEFSFTERTDAEVRGLFSAGGDLSYNSSTGAFSFSETYSNANELLAALLTVDGSSSGLDADTLDGEEGSYYLNASNMASGTLPSARLPDLTVADFADAAIQTGAESFSDSDSVLMTAAAVQDKILSYGYTTNVGDITDVTAGSGLTGGGASGSVTLNIGAGAGVTVNADNVAVNTAYFDQTAGGTGWEGNLEPSANNTYSLGSASNVWKDVYVGPGSLYIDGQKVLESNEGTITVSADPGQNLAVNTSSGGDIEFNAVGGGSIQLKSNVVLASGATLTTAGGGAIAFGGNLDLDSSHINNLADPVAAQDAATKNYVDGLTYVSAGDGLDLASSTFSVDSTVVRTSGSQSIAGVKTFSDDVILSGNLTVNGNVTTVNTETLSVADNIIDLNSDFTTGAPSQNAGIRILRGDESAVQLRWNEADDHWEFSNDGSNYTKIAVSTSDLAEGTNLYYTDARARGAISAGGDLSYNASTGVISFTERTDAEVRGLISTSGDLSYNSSTGVISFTERTDAEVRGLISATGSLSYNSSTGVISFTERTDAEVRGLLSGSGNINYNSSTGVISESLTTTDIDEGDNLYYTDARARAAISASGDLSYSNGVISFTERTDAEVRGLLSATGNINYNASTGVISESLTTDDIDEGGNLYYTVARANTAIDARVNKAFVDALNVDADTLDGNDTAFFRNASNLNSGTLASARLPELTVADFAGAAIQTGAESFSDVDTALMTAAAIQDKILSYGYTTNVGDITGVTAGSGLTGGGASGSVTLNIGAGTGITVNADNVAVDMSVFDTGDLSEGTNLYYTTARANSAIDARVNKAFVDALNINADLLDGVQGSNYARTDIAETFTSDLTVQGNLTVSGSVTTVNTEEVNIADNIIVLNSNEAGAPSQNAGIEVERGTSTNVQLRWNESSDQWEFSNDGSNYTKIAASTSDLAEGTNLYYTTARANSAIDARVNKAFVDALNVDADTLDGQHGSYYRNASNLNAGTLASARLPDLTVADFAGAAIQTSAEAFSDSDTVLMTAAAIEDRILSKGYTTNVGDITGVTAGAGLTGGGASGSVTLNIGAGTGITVNADNVAVDMSAFSTTNLSEGTNLYYTAARANTAIDARVNKAFVDALNINADLLDGQHGSFYRNADNLNAGTLNAARLPTNMGNRQFNYIESNTGSEIAIYAGETRVAVEANAGTPENVIIGAESGLVIYSSPDNWSSGWAGRNTATICDASGDSSLPGDLTVGGVMNGTATSARYADLSERYAMSGELREPGTVVVIGGDEEMIACHSENDHRVAGIVSTDPALRMNEAAGDDHSHPHIALTGRVPCKVVGPVAKGDLLVTSGVPGHACSNNDAQAGRILGKALESFDGEQGVIEVLVNIM